MGEGMRDPLHPLSLLLNLTRSIRSVVGPQLQQAESARLIGTAQSGDATFQIDDLAESTLARFIEGCSLPLAYYSEDRGLVGTNNPEGILIVDPLDGTRPATAGLETCVISAGWADPKPQPTLADVRYACLYEIKTDRYFLAEKGERVEIWQEGERVPVQLSPNEDLARMFWTAEIVARPASLIFPVLEELIDLSSRSGGFFIFNSSAFSLTRLLLGRFSAVVDLSGRLLEEVPGSRERFAPLAGGRPMGLYTYDIAAAYRAVREAGAFATDAWGRSLEEVPLLDTSEGNIQSLIATSNEKLHRKILEAINRGMEKIIHSSPWEG